MNELDMLKVINKNLASHEFIGDDCAEVMPKYKDKPLYITQDALIEGVHFSMDYITPYQLGVKAVSVNISDLFAALAEPQFLTISLSIPANTPENFIDEFYKGINYACQKYNCKVIGGDLTGSEKIAISICAIGQKQCSTKASRANAQINDAVVLCGQAGGSAIGFNELVRNKNAKSEFTELHLNPQLEFEAIKELKKLNIPKIASMDTSDGIADAVYKISSASNLSLEIDGEKIPTLKNFDKKCNDLNLNKEDIMFFGGEDYGLLITLPSNYAKKLPEKLFTIIGKVTNSNESFITFQNKKIITDENTIKDKAYNHFKKEKN